MKPTPTLVAVALALVLALSGCAEPAVTAASPSDTGSTGPTGAFTSATGVPTGPVKEPADQVRVPKLVGMSLADAKQTIRALGLDLATQVYSFNGDIRIGIRRVASTRPPGTILQQSIDPHTSVREGRSIKLVVAAPEPNPCDPSYPDVCIPPPPPDLDCPQVGYVNIRVIGSDPHGFDGYDNDGVGCES